MMARFAGKRAVVTGAAQGIGAAIAWRLAAEGAAVLAVDRHPGKEEQIDDVLICDVTDLDAGKTIAAAAGGPIDFLINNAGIGGATTLESTSDEDWERFIATNLTAVFRLCRDLLPQLSAPGGRIVNISSTFGLIGFPGSLAYGVSKAGIAQLTRQTAIDLAPRGILVNAIAPGVIETELTRERIENSSWYQDNVIKTTPVGRTGQPDDIAGVAAFLCSNDADYIAGQVLVVDGGWLAGRYLPQQGD
jgi:meso-butanediol dehydrogenase/(S,S)-butanediol dehydrogenase/diacetyl reductase